MKHGQGKLNSVRPITKLEDEVSDIGTCTDFTSTASDVIRPLTLSMRLFGLIHVNDNKTRWTRITQVYSALIVSSMWATFILLVVFDTLKSQLSFKWLHAWTFLCSVEATITNKACRKQNKFKAFMRSWSYLLDTRKDSNEDPEDRVIKRIRIKVTTSVLLSWACLLFCCGLVAYLAFLEKELNHVMDPVTDRFRIPLKVIAYIMFVYLCASWVFSLCLFFVMVVAIYQQFEIFNKSFSKAFMGNTEISNIESYRRRHLEVCNQLETADEIMSTFNAVCIFQSTFIGLLVLSSLTLSKAEIYLICTFWFICVACFVYVMVISVGGGYLHHMAHAPLKTLYHVRFRTISSGEALQVTMFLTKLTAESIGLTAMGMFVINRATISTIAGAFITYYIVILQFQQPSILPGLLHNCSSAF